MIHGRGAAGWPGLDIVFVVAVAQGASFDLFAVPPSCAVSACREWQTAASAGLRAEADPALGAVPAAAFAVHSGIRAVAAAGVAEGAAAADVAAGGVAGVSAPAEPRVGAVADAGVAGVPTDSEPRASAVEAAGVA